MSTDYMKAECLRNIPRRKVEDKIKEINKSTEDLQQRNDKIVKVNRFVESNIPLDYWNLKMDRDFKGDIGLLDKYNELTVDLSTTYKNGTSICFAGNHGRGKTMAGNCILKLATLKGYNCLYTTLSDIVNVFTSANFDDKFNARRELTMVDFLFIDEFDNRFMPSENAASLYGRTLETIFRTRAQNRLPTFMATNSPNILKSFDSIFEHSIESLFKGYLEFVIVMGTDFRGEK